MPHLYLKKEPLTNINSFASAFPSPIHSLVKGVLHKYYNFSSFIFFSKKNLKIIIAQNTSSFRRWGKTKTNRGAQERNQMWIEFLQKDKDKIRSLRFVRPFPGLASKPRREVHPEPEWSGLDWSEMEWSGMALSLHSTPLSFQSTHMISSLSFLTSKQHNGSEWNE